jgi:N-acetylneuraminic acid mutarotase
MNKILCQMKTFLIKIFIIIVLSALITDCKDQDSGKPSEDNNKLNWEKMSNFPGYIRIEAAGFWIGENFYTGLGFGYLDENFQTLDNLNDFYEYNSSSKVWTKKADFPGVGRMKVAAFSIGEKGYIGFGQSLVNCDQGCDQIGYKDIWEYDPILDHWETTGTYDQISNGETIYSKSYVINDKVYITFGYDLWVFNSSDKSLSKIGPLPESMILTTGFEINDKIYMGTGGTTDLNTLFYEFDPSTVTWTKKADLPGPVRRFASGFAFKGKGYILCGQGQKELSPGYYQFIGLKDTWQYDPVLDSWTKFNDYPGDAFIHQVSANSPDKACVGTGETGVDTFFGRDFWMLR